MSPVSGFGDARYSCDRSATVRAYRRIERGGVDTCGCLYCRNFRLARERIFSAGFLALLDSLGIDPKKDGEVYYNGPRTSDRHCYAGWYHFIGTLDEPGWPVEFGGDFRVWLCRASAPRLDPLKGLTAVQLEFFADAVPWLLDEPEPK